jgi:hypothetical protein
MPHGDNGSVFSYTAMGLTLKRDTHTLTRRWYDWGNALEHLLISPSTWLGSWQPNMGSFHMVQYLLSK